MIFVHGCFWHQHNCPLGKKQPRTRQEYWLPKLARNVERDRETGVALERLGWQRLVVWECQTSNIDLMRARLINFLEGVINRQATVKVAFHHGYNAPFWKRPGPCPLPDDLRGLRLGSGTFLERDGFFWGLAQGLASRGKSFSVVDLRGRSRS